MWTVWNTIKDCTSYSKGIQMTLMQKKLKTLDTQANYRAWVKQGTKIWVTFKD